MIILKTNQEIDIMDKANKIVHDVLDYVESNTLIGDTTKEIENKVIELIHNIQLAKEINIIPAFKDYMGYPSSICISINEEVVHGIPGERIIKDGDIVSVDFGVIYEGFVGDAARTFIIGNASKEVIKLVRDTKKALKLGIDQMRVGNRLYDIGKAISFVAQQNKYGNVKTLSGHSIGRQLHEPPAVFNYINKNEPNVRLQNGMVLALEPMFNLGTSDVKILKDNWTVVTKDKKPSAHWEVSVAITKGEPRILGNSKIFSK